VDRYNTRIETVTVPKIHKGFPVRLLNETFVYLSTFLYVTLLLEVRFRLLRVRGGDRPDRSNNLRTLHKIYPLVRLRDETEIH
jgi:hypothetical protein